MRFLRLLLFTVCIVSLSQSTDAQDIILPTGQTLTKAPWQGNGFRYCFYNISSNTIKARDVVFNGEKQIDGQNVYESIGITIYNNNGTIWKQFTLTPPSGYDFMKGPLTVAQLFKVGSYLQLTDDYFNNDDLVEVLVEVGKNDGDGDLKAMVLNENNQVVLDFGNLNFNIDFIFLFPASTDGYVYILDESGDKDVVYILDSRNSSGINTVSVDNPSSVSPNPSNGAASVEVSWDYTLLDEAQLNVVDMDGKLVHTQSIKAGNRKTNLSTSRFSTGTYIYIVHGSNGYTSTGKFVIN